MTLGWRSDRAGDHSTPLHDLRVVDLSTGIAGGYASKLLGDAGAEVVKCLGRFGDPLLDRRVGGRESPLFEHLHADHLALRIAGIDEAAELLCGADVVVLGADTNARVEFPTRDVRAWCGDRSLVIAEISPFGRSGPLADVPANEFVLQAMSGKFWATWTASDRPPAAAGGEIGLWLGGSFAALAAVAALRSARRFAQRVEVDVSLFEAMVAVFGQTAVQASMDTAEPPMRDLSGHMIPGVHRARDREVAFAVVTAQQWAHFCVMIERPEWAEDRILASAAGRTGRIHEVRDAIDRWVGAHSAKAILDLAALLRVPAAVVADGKTVPQLGCYQSFFESETTGYARPKSALRFRMREYPALPVTTDAIAELAGVRPLAGTRVADFTAFWAGPYAASLLGMLGAEVVHVEAPTRPDGMRTRSVRPPTAADWLEWSSNFHANNGSKLGISVDMERPEGREVARMLIARSDVVLESFSPRVMEGFGFDAAGVAAIRPDGVYARMPAFGVDNPWRGRLAFQHTIEPLAGIAWISGHPDADPQPVMACDGLAGVHAALAAVCALHARARTGAGVDVEVRFSEVAAAVAAEQTTTAAATGVVLERVGNQSRWGRFQGLFATTGDADPVTRHWLAVSANTDEEWSSLVTELDRDGVVLPAGEDASDVFAQWIRDRPAGAVEARLRACEVPAAAVVEPMLLLTHEQLASRHFYTDFDHPVCGKVLYPSLPFVITTAKNGEIPSGQTRPAPTWGEHNEQVLGALGLSEDQRVALAHDGVLGTIDPTLSPM